MFLPRHLFLQDFGISGFRFGVLYTHNKEVASAMRAFGYLHGVSGVTQFKMCQLLQDRGTEQDSRIASCWTSWPGGGGIAGFSGVSTMYLIHLGSCSLSAVKPGRYEVCRRAGCSSESERKGVARRWRACSKPDWGFDSESLAVFALLGKAPLLNGSLRPEDKNSDMSQSILLLPLETGSQWVALAWNSPC